MYVLTIVLFLVMVSEKLFVTSMYDNVCGGTCAFPGMICASGRCKCNGQNRLFWTGVRCLSCPYDWSFSEIACIRLYTSPLNRIKAATVCQNMQADLFSYRDNSILALIYQVTESKTGRRRRQMATTNKTVAWTSAQATSNNLDLYQWDDRRINQFDGKHAAWCNTKTNLGYAHTHNEPSRLTTSNDSEKCVILRRGIPSHPIVCLDDVFCHEQYPFICERSESTAQKYPASLSTNVGSLHSTLNSNSKSTPSGNSKSTSNSNSKSTTNSSSKSTTTSYSKSTTSPYAGNDSNYNTSKDPTIGEEHNLGMLAKPDAPKSDNNTKMIIIILVIVLLLIASIIAGIFFYKKHRATTETQSRVDRDIKKDELSSNPRSSIISGASTNNINDEDELASHYSSTSQADFISKYDASPDNMNIDINDQKQQKNKRSGYSKQTFDEFE
ncbi:unnamed protein product [Adineta steineri]|uniref:C-type lectin domain-containing protein n=1 Tax=Adineta steineri TaxID=433720 RepID=A0A813NH61_9BILA|nr:unnamed protein product [Adineta steineri]